MLSAARYHYSRFSASSHFCTVSFRCICYFFQAVLIANRRFYKNIFEILLILRRWRSITRATTCRSKRKLPHCFLCGSFCFFSAAPLRAPTVPFRLILPPQKAVFARRICGRSAARLSREWLPVLPKGRTIPEKKASEHRSGHLFYCFLPFLQCFL